MIQVFGFFNGVPGKFRNSVIQLINPTVLRRVFSLAKEEMNVVKELDHRLVSENEDKLWLYYGSKDGWTPVKYYEDMRAKHPKVQAQLCNRGFYHSFVLKSDKDMGNIVADAINENVF